MNLMQGGSPSDISHVRQYMLHYVYWGGLILGSSVGL